MQQKSAWFFIVLLLVGVWSFTELGRGVRRIFQDRRANRLRIKQLSSEVQQLRSVSSNPTSRQSSSAPDPDSPRAEQDACEGTASHESRSP